MTLGERPLSDDLLREINHLAALRAVRLGRRSGELDKAKNFAGARLLEEKAWQYVQLMNLTDSLLGPVDDE